MDDQRETERLARAQHAYQRDDRRCRVCGAHVGREDYGGQRLCPRHLIEARKATAPFVDGSRVTPGTEGCKCDGPCPHCTDGCEACEGTGRRLCEFPCWQRLGMTSEPCCSDCAPLDEPEPEQLATVAVLAPSVVPCLHRWMRLANGSWCCTLCGAGGGGE